MTTPANLRGWGQGWPVDRSDDMVTVRTERSRTSFTVHRDIGPLVKWLCDEVERRGYLIDHGPGDENDDWSYVNRAIRGRNVPSNHSWGLAIDIDATQYPLGSTKRLPQWIVDLFKKYGFDYGGDWRTRPDPMHFEFNGWPREARWLVASLAGHSIAQTPPPVPPSAPRPPAPPPKDWFSMATKAELKEVVREVVREEHGKTRKWIKEELSRVTSGLTAEIRARR
jgi:hypothetical protein